MYKSRKKSNLKHDITYYNISNTSSLKIIISIADNHSQRVF
jgi:hypothetical protein